MKLAVSIHGEPLLNWTYTPVSRTVVACRHDGNRSREPRRALTARAEAGIEVMRPADSQQGSEAAGPPVLPA